MSTYDFWYGEEELLNVYIKAYFEKSKYEAWINGYYNYVAHVTAIANMFNSKKEKDIPYPDYDIDKKEKIDIKGTPKNNNDYEFLSQYY